MQLALGLYEEGIRSIDQSIAFAAQANSPVLVAYGESFKGILLLASGDPERGQEQFQAGISRLKAEGSEEAQAYVGQLEVAKEIFVSR